VSSSAAPASAIMMSAVSMPAAADGIHHTGQRLRPGICRGTSVTGPVAKAVIGRSVAPGADGDRRARHRARRPNTLTG
jgi:hypothetical protein